MNHDEQQAEIARLRKAVDDALCTRFGESLAEIDRLRKANIAWQAKWESTVDNAVAGTSKQLQAAEAEIAAKDRDIQALRGELAILMEVVEALPDELLEKVPEAKLLRAFQAMTEADKHKHMNTVIDRQAAEIESWKKRFTLVNEALRRSTGVKTEEDGS